MRHHSPGSSLQNTIKAFTFKANISLENARSFMLADPSPFKTVLAAVIPVNKTEGAKPAINTVLDETTLVYDVITGTDVFSIAGSDLQNVKAQLAAALEPGEYTLKVYTRSGLGDQYGVHVATRKVQVG